MSRKIVYSLAATGAFFVMLELVLAGIGVRPILYQDDPYVGFASNIPLFVEQEEAGAPHMVTAQNKLKWFNSQRFLKDKPRGTYRIFCVGGSTTYGRPYDDTTSFAGWLREYLVAADPSRTWELINAGGISYASYRVAMVMEELVRYQPDLFIIYSGHNEFLEGRTYESLLRIPSAIRGVGGLLSHTRTFATVQRLVSGGAGTNSATPSPREVLPAEVKTLLDNGVGLDAYSRDDQWRQQVLDHYHFNLNRMIDIARSVGAGVILVTPASNLQDCSPFKSQHRGGLGDVDRQRWQALIDRAEEARNAARWEDALAALDEAERIDDRHAHLHYLRGHVLLGAGRFHEAKAAFVRARDEDICPLRALTPVRRTVEKVAAQQDVPLVDFIALVESRSDHGIPGDNLFFDHVHPTLEGNRMLARALLDKMAAMGIAKPGASWGDEMIREVTRRVEGGLDRQAHGLALRNLAKVLSWAGKEDESNKLALRAAELVTGDANSYYLAGNAHLKNGELDQAILQFQKALRLEPGYLEVHNSLGAVYQMLGKLDQAVAEYENALLAKPDFAPAHCNLGVVLQRQQKLDQATAHFEEAIRINPRYSKARNNFGVLLRGQGELDRAAAQFREAIQIDPNLAEAHFNLGVVLAMKGNHPQAVAAYQDALRANPNYTPAHQSLGLELLRTGAFREGMVHLQHAATAKRPSISATSALAWMLATCPDQTLRNGEEAVRWAEYTVKATGAKLDDPLSALAAAYAETGKFEEAVRWQARAVEVAPADRKAEHRRRLALYQANRPFQPPEPGVAP